MFLWFQKIQMILFHQIMSWLKERNHIEKNNATASQRNLISFR